MTHAEASRLSDQYCKQGTSWRPHPVKLHLYSYDRYDAATTAYSAPSTPEKPQKNPPRGFIARLGDAIVARISGRYRFPPLQEPPLIEVPDERPTRIKVANPKG